MTRRPLTGALTSTLQLLRPAQAASTASAGINISRGTHPSIQTSHVLPFTPRATVSARPLQRRHAAQAAGIPWLVSRYPVHILLPRAIDGFPCTPLACRSARSFLLLHSAESAGPQSEPPHFRVNTRLSQSTPQGSRRPRCSHCRYAAESRCTVRGRPVVSSTSPSLHSPGSEQAPHSPQPQLPPQLRVWVPQKPQACSSCSPTRQTPSPLH